MYQCKNCGRYLKSSYNNCPGCGSNNFQQVDNTGVMKITNVPQGGYKINFNNIKKDNIFELVLIIFGIIFIGAGLYTTFVFIGFNLLVLKTTGESVVGSEPILFDLPFIIIGVVLLYVGIKANKKHKVKIEKLKKLTQIGVLIKNLPYDVKPTGTIVNGRSVYCIEIMYELDNGTKIPLISEGRHDGQLSSEEGTVDLLIDPNDYSNYYIDFEIY